MVVTCHYTLTYIFNIYDTLLLNSDLSINTFFFSYLVVYMV